MYSFFEKHKYMFVFSLRSTSGRATFNINKFTANNIYAFNMNKIPT